MAAHIDELLRALSAHAEPVSMAELREELAGQVPERTLRRGLAKLVDEGLVQALGLYKARRYLLLPRTSMQASKPTVFSAESEAIIQKVQRPIFQRDPCAYQEAWLAAYIPNQSFYLSELQRERLAKNSFLMVEEQAAHTYTQKIFNRLLIDLSYNSSRLEGNTYSLLETQQLLFEGKMPVDKLDVEKLMILNHQEAIKFLVEGVHRIAMNMETIRTMHYLLADGLVPASGAGQIREESVRVSLTTYAPMENKHKLSQLLELIANTAAKIRDPFEQSFFVLVHISYLQAFIDVNKRTARLCANIPLVKNNRVPLSFNDMDKDDYISAIIAIYEYREVKPLAELYVWSYLRSCKQYQVLSETLGFDVIHVRYRMLRRQLMAQIIREKITGAVMQSLIIEFAKENISEEDRAQFIQNVLRELSALESFKLAGMGVSQQEFAAWKKLTLKA